MLNELEQLLEDLTVQNPGMTHDDAMGVVVDLVEKEIKTPEAKDN